MWDEWARREVERLRQEIDAWRYYNDAEKAKDEIERLQGENNDCHSVIRKAVEDEAGLKTEIERLHAENEFLRAGFTATVNIEGVKGEVERLRAALKKIKLGSMDLGAVKIAEAALDGG